ncbi:radical SAM enzyme [Basidiobolus meristosporus CBS 931.73]|uniref:Radical S-adenosyl methionine domain-containing protein 1, mitochondrial n=1 Tax=Basidiobolus meristosporus CBS 931.73 TaxID=1314790 RepID=A0A1Y1YDK6_9FUNG|nr:radical SAM enzyme [Basidiobolus meristosporus CBS 931.73]|eukprot:ORX96100.1 radical SAM enzyme [Basidiobolus meristosporus CBS 931.73]
MNLFPRRGRSVLRPIRLLAETHKHFTTNAHTDAKQPVSVYVHWPYCKSKCTYCNFNRYINPRPDHDRMEAALISELSDAITRGYEGRTINSVYFGGGTPSLAKPTTFQRILDEISRRCYLPSDAEISIEGNPTSVETSKLVDFKAIGVNRVSLGIQALNDTDLKIFGRDHSVEEALDCLREAKKIFPGQVTFDLIYGREGQTLENWEKELKIALSLADDHISLYQLTLKRGTEMFNRYRKGSLQLPEEVSCDMYEINVEIAAMYGFKHYEVSNFARNQRISKHNNSYWEGLDYIGIGPGAHGRVYDSQGITRQRTFRIASPEGWMKQCEQIGHGLRKSVELSVNEMKVELVLFGLRTMTGIPEARFSFYSNGDSLSEFLNMGQVESLVDAGLLIWTSGNAGGLQPTEEGLKVIDSILPRILP